MRDVLVAGGGPAGLAAAIALAERGANAVVVDGAGGVSASRGELLPHGALDLIARLGLSHITTEAVKIENVVSRWGAGRAQSHLGVPGLGLHGWAVDRHRLSLAMLKRVSDLGVRVIKDRIATHVHSDDSWTVTTTRGAEALRARYIIDATGRPASVARRHGARQFQDTDLVTVMWKGPEGTGPAHMQAEAASLGWWYALPFAEGRTVGYATSAAEAKRINTAPDAFLATAQRELTLIDLDGLRTKADLMDSRSAVLDAMSGTGWLATGDAAAAFDPIASQGLFNALSGGFFAGNAAADVVAGDADAALVYEALAARSAARSHSMTRMQYAAHPFESAFWINRTGLAAMEHPNARRAG
ncbi:NAD(P)/FAD-dependent oxidoreductase [Roseovarius sp.]|uniref:NAD(P)/FAD-dependent oxidoreductase n=1 Tax=Roseovarius sp. TaxID=1486281 RepID=UPI00356732D8